MPDGGISLPVSIAQSGAVAKTQARGQQAAQQTQPVDPQKQLRDELKVERVKETEKPDRGRIDPDEERLDKRQRRRLKRQRGKDRDGSEADDGGETPSDAVEIGRLVDCRA
jgi:hypothetical protein